MKTMLMMFLKFVVFFVAITGALVGNVQGKKLPECCVIGGGSLCMPTTCDKPPCCTPPRSDTKP
jgi:hypothetical protein